MRGMKWERMEVPQRNLTQSWRAGSQRTVLYHQKLTVPGQEQHTCMGYYYSLILTTTYTTNTFYFCWGRDWWASHSGHHIDEPERKRCFHLLLVTTASSQKCWAAASQLLSIVSVQEVWEWYTSNKAHKRSLLLQWLATDIIYLAKTPQTPRWLTATLTYSTVQTIDTKTYTRFNIHSLRHKPNKMAADHHHIHTYLSSSSSHISSYPVCVIGKAGELTLHRVLEIMGKY